MVPSKSDTNKGLQLGIQYYNPTTSHPEVTPYPPTGDMLTSSVDCAQGTVSIIQYIQWHSMTLSCFIYRTFYTITGTVVGLLIAIVVIAAVCFGICAMLGYSWGCLKTTEATPRIRPSRTTDPSSQNGMYIVNRLMIERYTIRIYINMWSFAAKVDASWKVVTEFVFITKTTHCFISMLQYCSVFVSVWSGNPKCSCIGGKLVCH